VRPGSVQFENVSRRFRVYPQRNMTLKEAIVRRREIRPIEIWALQDVSLEIEPGEAVGFVGRNGSGKTTLLRLVAGIFGPTSGRVAVDGQCGSLLNLGAGFHPDFTGRENVYLSGAIYGLNRRTITERLDEIVSFAELEQYIDLPVRTYSSGMFMRLGFAIAINVDADILLLDEIFAVGDEAFQRKCIDRIFDFKRAGGTIAFVSHAAAAVQTLCDRAVLLRRGRVEFDGSAHEAIRRYQALLAEDEDPAEREAGLREWGTGELRIEQVRVESEQGAERDEFLPGEGLAIAMDVVCRQDVARPRLLVELRTSDGALLAVAEHSFRADECIAGARVPVRFEVPTLPVIDGRFTIGLALTDAKRGHQYHRLERAAGLVVNGERASGWVRLDGQFLVGSIVPAAPA
jgi:ABC-type polysaccharide/polyol phosphate transport system ATPase subunit